MEKQRELLAKLNTQKSCLDYATSVLRTETVSITDQHNMSCTTSETAENDDSITVEYLTVPSMPGIPTIPLILPSSPCPRCSSNLPRDCMKTIRTAAPSPHYGQLLASWILPEHLLHIASQHISSVKKLASSAALITRYKMMFFRSSLVYFCCAQVSIARR